MVAFATIEAAGNLIDLFGGFTLSSSFDPLSMSQNSVFGRLHQMLAIVLLFALNLHLVVIGGLIRSYDAIPLGAGLSLSSVAQLATHGLSTLLLSAAQIAGPLIAVLFLADVGLALMTRVAPSMNVFSLGFPLKMLITLSLVGLTFPQLGRVLSDLVTSATNSTLSLGG
jgi:flagellar biosynthetic protein FliR